MLQTIINVAPTIDNPNNQCISYLEHFLRLRKSGNKFSMIVNINKFVSCRKFIEN